MTAISEAFSKFFSQHQVVREAYSVVKGLCAGDLALIKRVEKTDDSVNNPKDSPYDALMAKAEALKQANPGLSVAQAFSKAFSDPNNRELAAQERAANRPRA